MGVRDRIEDARILWTVGREEGAVIQVLVAFSATVRKRYPHPMRDGIATRRFIKDEIAKITNGPCTSGTDHIASFYYNGKHNVGLDRILYDFLRCDLIHEGKLPTNLTLIQPVLGKGNPMGRNPAGKPYDGKLFNKLALNDVTGFPIGWVWNLIRVVAEAPENQSDFPNGTYPLPNGYSVNAGFMIEYPDEHPDRFPPNAPPRQNQPVATSRQGKRSRSDR